MNSASKRQKNILIIGAGASRGARNPSPPDGTQLLPVLEGLLDRLKKAKPDSPLNFHKTLAAMLGKGTFFSKEEIELASQFISRALCSGKSYEGAIADVLDNNADGGRALLLLLNRLIAFTFCFNNKGMGPLVEGFRPDTDGYDQCVDKLQIDPSWVIVSLNYDILFEQALCRKNISYFYPEMNVGMAGDNSGLPLFKIHGSVNWFPCQAQVLHTETPTPEETRRATTGLSWDESNRRFSIDFPDIAAIQYDLIYQELLDDDPLLKSPVMAHYGPRKPIDVNFPFLDRVRKASLAKVDEIKRAFIIGVRPISKIDDPVLFQIFENLKGKDVQYINPSKDDCESINSMFGFTTIQKRFDEWLKNH